MGDYMNVEMTNIEKENFGWNMQFNVILTSEEASKCNIDFLKTVGDYEIQFEENIISFKCLFDQAELKTGEKIEERIELIKIDIANLAKSCLK